MPCKIKIDFKSILAYSIQPGKWKFVLSEDLTVNVGESIFGRSELSFNGKLLGIASDKVLTIKSGYAIDGCSPSFLIFGKRIGTPTPESTIAAAFIHDFMYQFLDIDGTNWTRGEADKVFYKTMKQEKFLFASVYFFAVRIFGGVFHCLKKETPESKTCIPARNIPIM